MSGSKNQITDLVQNIQDTQGLGDESASIIRNLGDEIQNSLGMPAIDVPYQRALLIIFVIDDSGSMEGCGNTDLAIEGYNGILEAMKKTKNPDIMVYTRFLNGGDLHPFCLIENAKKLDRNNYQPNGLTPLYDVTLETLATVAVKFQDFVDNGIPVNTLTIIITDGHDEGSKVSPSKVAVLVKDLLTNSESHIIAAMGIDDGKTDFRDVFKEMGLLDKWILTPKNTPHEIREKFGMLSQSAVRASQGAVGFSKVAQGGGFTTP